jgi:hypothetical protein
MSRTEPNAAQRLTLPGNAALPARRPGRLDPAPAGTLPSPHPDRARPQAGTDARHC